MTKDDVKTLVAGDDRMAFWCSVFFGEVCELVDIVESQRSYSANEGWPLVVRKVREFKTQVQARMIETANERLEKRPTLEQRVEALERKVGS